MHSHKQHIRPEEHGPIRRGSAADLTAAILTRLFGEAPGPILLAVGGPGGTGKSTFARQLADRLGTATVLQLDNYKTSRSTRRKTNLFGPHPDANRMQLIADHLAMLRDGTPVAAPVYDRDAGEAISTREILPQKWIVVDGEVSTYSRFRQIIDFAIFIDSDWRTQLATRLGRDLEARGYSPDKAVATFLHSNLREFAEHGASSKQWADLHLFCHDDYRLELESVAQPVYEDVREVLHDSMIPVNVEGLIVPILTPFAEDGKIASRAFVEHLDWLANAGVRRILLGGSVGEGFSLTAAEKLTLLKLALEYFPGLLLFHTGGTALPEAIQLAGQAAQLGADGVVCSSPQAYPTAAAEGVVEYLERVASATDLPLFLDFDSSRECPDRKSAILHRTQHEGFIESAATSICHDGHAPRFVGDEAITRGMPEGRVSGIFSGAANATPELLLRLENSWRAGWHGDDQHLLVQIGDLMCRLGNRRTAAIKQLLSTRLKGYPTAVRPPLASLPVSAM